MQSAFHKTYKNYNVKKCLLIGGSKIRYNIYIQKSSVECIKFVPKSVFIVTTSTKYSTVYNQCQYTAYWGWIWPSQSKCYNKVTSKRTQRWKKIFTVNIVMYSKYHKILQKGKRKLQESGKKRLKLNDKYCSDLATMDFVVV